MSQQLLDGLNPQQRAAVTAGNGPVLVLAGPGSGKTRVLTHRIAFLLNDMRVAPYNIMAVTFTNKAAAEMRSRINSLLGSGVKGLQIGTFHATCARILRIEHEHTPYGEDYTIFDTDDQISAIGQAMSELNIDSKKYSPRQVLNHISSAKNELILPQQYEGDDYYGEIVSRVYERYQHILRDSNAMDFDDLLLQMVLLLRGSEAVRDKYQAKYRYILVDEFQDTNMAQYELVQLLGGPQNNIFVVGDEDQSIYAFRGANYRNVLHFEQDYPDCKKVLLEQNYRSTQIVLDAARAIIDHNRNRTPKALFTDRQGGQRLTIQEAYDENEEAEFIVGQINHLSGHIGRIQREGQYTFNDFAVMYRTNAQSRALEEAFIREGIPYTLVGGVGFYKRREVRDLMAYLKLVNNPDDRISFARVINTPRRGIGNKSLTDFQHWAATANMSYGDVLNQLVLNNPTPLTDRVARLFRDFAGQLESWQEIAKHGDLVTLFDTIMGDTGYAFYLNEISETAMQQNDRAENLQELRGLLQRAMDEELSLTDFLIDQALISDMDSLDKDADKVTLLTLHAAKGLEYPVVFITGLEDGLLPHNRSQDDVEAIEEERRLLYVGLTRARDSLFLSYAFRRAMYGGFSAGLNDPSPFLYDLPLHLVDNAPTGLSEGRRQREYESQTRWDGDAPSRLQQDLERSRTDQPVNDKMRSKIIPFPGSKPSPYRPNVRVWHPIFGEGIVQDVTSVSRGQDHELTIHFEDHGQKIIYARESGIKLLDD